MYNKVIMGGNLTRDPEIKYLPSGAAIVKFTIAVNSKVKRDGEYKDDVLFIEVVTFGKLAENCGQYLSKGKKCLVDGRLQEQRWEKDGQKYHKVQIIAGEVRFLSAKGEPSAEKKFGDQLDSSEPF